MTERLSEEALREDIRKALRSTLSFEESVNNVLSLILQERQAWGEQERLAELKRHSYGKGEVSAYSINRRIEELERNTSGRSVS